jgi:hypothetical protein
MAKFETIEAWQYETLHVIDLQITPTEGGLAQNLSICPPPLGYNR